MHLVFDPEPRRETRTSSLLRTGNRKRALKIRLLSGINNRDWMTAITRANYQIALRLIHSLSFHPEKLIKRIIRWLIRISLSLSLSLSLSVCVCVCMSLSLPLPGYHSSFLLANPSPLRPSLTLTGYSQLSTLMVLHLHSNNDGK